MVGYIPQIIQTVRTKSVRDLNPVMYTMTFVGVFLMEIYAIHLYVNTGFGGSFLITNTMSVTLAFIMLVLVFLYRRPKYAK